MAEIKPWDSAYELSESPEYDPIIRKLKTSDPANADTVFNPLFQQIIENIHAVKLFDDTRAKADLSNVSKDTFKEFVENTGVTGSEGSVAAKDLSNVSKEDFQIFAETVGITGPDGNVAAKDLSNVSMEDFKVFVEEAGITGPNGNVASKPVVTEVTLPSAGWVGSAVPYTQAVTVSGVVKTADTESLLYVAPKQDTVTMETVSNCGVTATALSKNSVTFSAAEEKPATDIVFQIVNAGVVALSGGEV